MRISALAAICAIIIALPAIASLEVGATAPMFAAQASLDGKEFDFSLGEALTSGPVVVYFYPSAYTSGCNIQAHEFAVNMDKFNAAGASVVGVSLDSIDRLNDFSADPDYCAGKLAVASDESGEIARSYEVIVSEGKEGSKDSRGASYSHGYARRTTFVVTPDGRVAETIGGVSPMQNVQLSLEAVQKLQ